MKYTAGIFFISTYNSAPLFTLLSNGDVGSLLEPELVCRTNTQEGDITVSCVT